LFEESDVNPQPNETLKIKESKIIGTNIANTKRNKNKTILFLDESQTERDRNVNSTRSDFIYKDTKENTKQNILTIPEVS